MTLFCEDRDHEQFIRALVSRFAREVGIRPVIHAPSARGGEGKAISEFKLWQRAFVRGEAQGTPDLLVLAIDGNCKGWKQARSELEAAVDGSKIPNHVIACPDPHIERWYIADPKAFERVVGALPRADQEKCERGFYKRLVEEAAERAGTPLLTGTADLAPDLVDGLDLYRAAKNQPSLGHFLKGLRAALRQLASV